MANIGCHAGLIGHVDQVIGAKDAYAVNKNRQHVLLYVEDKASGEQFGVRLAPAQARNLAAALKDVAAEVAGADPF